MGRGFTKSWGKLGGRGFSKCQNGYPIRAKPRRTGSWKAARALCAWCSNNLPALVKHDSPGARPSFIPTSTFRETLYKDTVGQNRELKSTKHQHCCDFHTFVRMCGYHIIFPPHEKCFVQTNQGQENRTINNNRLLKRLNKPSHERLQFQACMDQPENVFSDNKHPRESHQLNRGLHLRNRKHPNPR